MGALYRLDFPNGKSYVGITSGTVEGRFKEHSYNTHAGKADRAVNRAIRKYGADTVRCVTLAIASEWAYLQAAEIKAIAVFGTFGKQGYNMTTGGEGSLGYRHTPEALAKMSEIHKGKKHHTTPHSAEAKAKMSASQKGKRLSPEHARNIAKSLIGNTRNAGKKQNEAHIEARRKGIYSSTKSRGVSWCKRTKKWRAHITVAGKMRDLGRHDRLEDAVAAREKAVALVLAGEAA